MKISIVQFKPDFADVVSNTNKVNQLLAGTKDSSLVVLPELSNTGYNFMNKEQAIRLAETVVKSAFVEMLIDHARKNNQYIVSGFHELSGDLLFNTSVLVSKDGVTGKYRKVHLFMHEKEIFEPGNLGFPVFELEGFKLGMLICFDYLFSEAWRILGLKGADVIAHPSNLITGNAQKVMPARALSNRFYTLTANRTGTERNLTFNGQSFAVDPSGEIIAGIKDDSEKILTFNIDPSKARNKFITPLNHVFEDRIPSTYQGLTDDDLS